MLRDEWRRHPIDIAPEQAYSPAPVSKAYLRAVGVTPPIERSDVPTVFSLLGLWPWVIAERLTTVEATAEARATLDPSSARAYTTGPIGLRSRRILPRPAGRRPPARPRAARGRHAGGLADEQTAG